MRLPFTQLANEVAEQHGPVLSEALGINLMEAIGGIAYLHHLAVANCPDDCLPSEAPPFMGAAARTLEARLCWKGPDRPAGQWLLAAQELGLVDIEGEAVSPLSVRVRGLHRYDATYKEREASRQRRDAAREKARVRRTVGEPLEEVRRTVASDTQTHMEKDTHKDMHAGSDRARARDIAEAMSGPDPQRLPPPALKEPASDGTLEFAAFCSQESEKRGKQWDGPLVHELRRWRAPLLLELEKRAKPGADPPDERLRRAYVAYLSDAGRPDYLNKAGHPWRLFASQALSYVARLDEKPKPFLGVGVSEFDPTKPMEIPEGMGVDPAFLALMGAGGGS